jgi:hypothetical protein
LWGREFYFPLSRCAPLSRITGWMHPDMGRFRRSVGERTARSTPAGLVIAAELYCKGAAHAEEMKIIRSAPRRLDHHSSAASPRDNALAVERHHRRRLHDFERTARAGRFASSRYLRVFSGHATPRSPPEPDRVRCAMAHRLSISASPSAIILRFQRSDPDEQHQRALGVKTRRRGHAAATTAPSTP